MADRCPSTMQETLHDRAVGSTVPGDGARACSPEELKCHIWLVLLAITAFWVAFKSPVDHAGSDPKGTLLTSQAILESGSARLDSYAAQDNSWVSPGQPDRFVSRHDHIYYRFPMAPALVSLPFVWMANLQGKDMHKPTTDAETQNLLSALLVAVSVLLAYSLGRRFADPMPALLLTVGFVFGGPIMSTGGTALWNSGVAALLGIAAVMLMTDFARGQKPPIVLLAMLLVLSLFSRPTMAVLFGLSVPYVWKVRRDLWVRFTVVLTCTSVAVFLVHVRLYDGCLLAYYHPSRMARPWWLLMTLGCVALGGVYLGRRLLPRLARQSLRGSNRASSGDGVDLRMIRPSRRVRVLFTTAYGLALAMLLGFLLSLPRILNRSTITRTSILPNYREVTETLRAAYGVLLSPGRGVFVYSPYLLLTLVAILAGWRRLKTNPLFWLSAAWFAVHTLTVARPFRWHGGHCFGSRMYLDAFSSLMLLTLLAWQARPTRRSRLLGLALGIAVGFGVFINTYQGMFNRNTILWNRDPNVDVYSRQLLDWRYPLFLASPSQLEARAAEHERWLAERAEKALNLPGLRVDLNKGP
ncbi:hypothetical protein JXA88_07195 [Candidatus Fermentibacteria bacterium]|nr:hypothetical protein [Candidatus Fermentibacteria bacterium]